MTSYKFSLFVTPGVDFMNCFLPYAKLFALYTQILRSFCDLKFGVGSERLMEGAK